MRIGPFGIWEILILAGVLFLIFGARRLPDITKGVTESVREFRKSIRDAKEEVSRDDEAEPIKATVVDTVGTPMKMKVADTESTPEAKQQSKVS